MAKKIEICKGHNCKEKNSESLKLRLENICKELEYEIVTKDCSGHCSKGPTVCIEQDIYSGNQGIFLNSDKKVKNFLINYSSSTNIEGYCKKAEGKDCGLAVDIGTTVIKASLNDLETKTVLGKVSTFNKQNAYGSTVLHRWNYINKAKDREKNLSDLSNISKKIVKDIEKYFINESGAKIQRTVLSGNTCMTYLFSNDDPALTLENKPDYKIIKTKDNITLLPCIFEWVGGDIVSGMTYLDFDKFDKNKMLIDLGTNGEVALSTKDGAIIVAAASAGPAFEGEGFRCGMLASKGAIHEVSSEKGKLKYMVLDSKKPLGLCGSGMLDLIAEMLANNIMGSNGRLDEKLNNEFFLTKDISVNQPEIDYFKESKAAVFATVHTLMQEMEMSYDDLDVIYVAGGFGKLNVENAQFIGLFPPFDNYKIIGNSSLKGAQSCLDEKNLERAKIIADSSTPLHLTESDNWMNNYLASLFFPHTDVKMFDKVLNTR